MFKQLNPLELIQLVFQKEIKSHLPRETKLLQCSYQLMNQTYLSSLSNILMKKLLQLLHGKMMTKTPFQLVVLELKESLKFMILMQIPQQVLTHKVLQVLEFSKMVESSKEGSLKICKSSNGMKITNNIKPQALFPILFMPQKSSWTTKINTLVLKLNRQLKFQLGKLIH